MSQCLHRSDTCVRVKVQQFLKKIACYNKAHNKLAEKERKDFNVKYYQSSKTFRRGIRVYFAERHFFTRRKISKHIRQILVMRRRAQLFGDECQLVQG